MAGPQQATRSLAVSVHGPAGVLDLVLPPGATAPDVAREYAARAGLARAPFLRDRVGRPLAADVPLAEDGVVTGDLLVAADPGAGPVGPARPSTAAPGPGDTAPADALPVLWFCLSGGVAVLAGWCGVRSEGATRDLVVALLAVGAVLGLLPVGRLARQRVVVAPVHAAAAALVALWRPGPEQLPLVLGTAVLAAAVAAAVGRALQRDAEEALRVWVVVGTLVFLLMVGCTLADAPPRVAWTLLLLAAMLMARFVPVLAVDVPDQLLLDVERLAVTAWSARERPTGRRGRTVVPLAAVATAAARGTRLVTACCAAVLGAVAVASPMLLATATLPVDRTGARLLVGLAGGALLLAARSYRHVAARGLLRAAGLSAWAALAVALLGQGAPRWATVLALALTAVSLLVVVVAVATGRGWRSAWWARRAEVAEAVAGAFAIAAALVASGLFRVLWETTS